MMKNALPGSKEPVVAHNSYIVQHQEKKYEVTSRHAVEMDGRYFSLSGGPDVAIRDVTAASHSERVNNLDASGNLADVSGVVMVTGTDVRGASTVIHVPYVRATLPLLRILFNNYDAEAEKNKNLASLKDSYMCVLPSELGHINEYGVKGIQGLSGSFSEIFDSEGKKAVSGPLSHVKNVDNSCLTFTNVCSTIGFISTRQSVFDVIDAYEKKRTVASTSQN